MRSDAETPESIDLFLHQQGLDTTTPAGKAMFQMLGVFAEFERSIIQERVRAGLQRAKREGKRLGRPPIADKLAERLRAGRYRKWQRNLCKPAIERLGASRPVLSGLHHQYAESDSVHTAPGKRELDSLISKNETTLRYG
jgi:DNA invertase Pin-like site-specific DNA recombinase